MAKILTSNKNYYDIADTIRQMKNVNTTYKPREMASALKDIYSNEVEGTLPLSFEANGNNLLNYRIDGASGGVGERTKNLLNNILNTQTKNGVTFTVNEDKSVTCNGKNQNEGQGLFITIGDYSATNNVILSGGVSGGNLSSYILQAYTLTDNPVVYYDDGNGVTLLAGKDYRIQIRIAGDYTCNNLTFYPMIRLATVADNSYEPYGYKVPVVVNGKNLLQNTATSRTINGVTFTVNEDGSVTCNGTASDTAWFVVNRSFDLYAPEGRIASIGNNGSTSTFYMNISYLGNVTTSRNYSKTIHQNVYVQLVIAAGYTCDNLTFYPMIRKADIEDDTYEPYIEPTTTNIYLDEPIEDGESISLSDTNVNIPTIEGTNVLTIDTTVQPSNVYIQAPKDSIEATQIANELEEI